MKPRYYKLTDHNGRTHNNTQWGPGIRHEATGKGTRLCSDGWIHCYTDKYVAVLRNPADANFDRPQCWLFEPEGESLIGSLKCGFKVGTTVKRVPLPRFTTNQKVAAAIFCAKAASDWKGKDAWNVWADKWLSGEDRTAYSAYSAASAASAAYRGTTYSAACAACTAYSTASAAYSAASAASAASADRVAACTDRVAACTAYSAACADSADIDFPALARRAYRWKDAK